MARADRRRTKRTRPAAGIRASGQATVVEQTLFFSRLRRQAKWAFVFLALVFAGGFVLFGVGSDVPGGVADILQGRSPTSGPSVEEAQDRLERNPRDAEALRNMVDALQAEGRPDEATPFLQRYVGLRPRDEEALRELAGLYRGRAGRFQNELQAEQIRAQLLNPGSDFMPPASSPLGQALGSPPIANAIDQEAQSAVTGLLQRMQASFQAAQRVYQRLVVLRPDDAALELDLADAAVNAGDTEAALAAYRRFVELAPDDPRSPLVQQEIERLEGATVQSAPTG